MFDGIPQELKDEAEKVLRKAAVDVFSVTETVQNLVDDVSAQLDAWADALAGKTGGSETLSQQDKYNYLLEHSTEYEKSLFKGAESYLLEDVEVLNDLYEEKLAQVEAARGGREDKYDFWSELRKGWNI